ncbi:glycoside hydrolase superfamily [Infundibulicybe gibba]|nr:glycoside hydrolase superfamily [Infundibulicybe gibba]
MHNDNASHEDSSDTPAHSDSPAPGNASTHVDVAAPSLAPPAPPFAALSQKPSSTASTLFSKSSGLLPVLGKDIETRADSATPPIAHTRKRPRSVLLLAAVAAVLLIALAIILPIIFTVLKKKSSDGVPAAASSSPTPSSVDSGPPPAGGSTSEKSIYGGDGSTVTMEDGNTFVYKNKFGGYWASDPKNPFNNDARPNSWTPPLNATWTWGKDRVFGVNLGGLFVLEPFISPALFQRYPGSADEWSLSTLMAADTANGGLDQIEEHYKTFITEKDIADIAGAGLNWIRLPIPYWCVDKFPGEPYLARTSWKYILRLLGWARKYGLRVKLDLHTIPGSQNTYNHSGKQGQVNFLHGAMGVANAQRALYYIRVITEFISQPEYVDLVPIFGLMNEAMLSVIGRDQITSFYLEAHTMIRNITGTGAGKGPYISMHDSFGGIASWAGFLEGSDRIILDTHPYFAFDGSSTVEPIDSGTAPETAGGVWPRRACDRWAASINTSRADFGVTIAGEFSNGFNDCGLFLRNTESTGVTYPDCATWQDASTWSDGTKAGMKKFALASMDALQDWFFWTWKIGDSLTNKRVESPLWSYELGLRSGFMPTDPREAGGTCEALGISGPKFDGTFKPWQTGGAGAGTIAAASTAANPWPPTAISGVAGGGGGALLPTYTPTGTVVTLPPLPPPTASGATATGGNGWFNTQDTAGAPTPIAGCTYPNAWDAVDIAPPARCT